MPEQIQFLEDSDPDLAKLFMDIIGNKKPYGITKIKGLYFERPFRELVRVKTPSRNDPCPCGSGKKFKRCCLGKS